MLHKDLNFQPFKMMVLVQELSDRAMANRSTVAERLIGILSDDVIFLMADEAQFHISGCVKNRIFAIGRRKIHSSSISGLFTVHVLLSAVEWPTSESQALISLKT
jgi:hypothetical protein